MVPLAESFRRTRVYRLFGARAKASIAFIALTLSAVMGHHQVAFASGFTLDDDDALIVGSDSVVYSLNLSTAVATAGATMSGDAPTASFSALEADPTLDTAYLGSLNDGSFTDVDTTTGEATFIVTTYGRGASVDGLVRLDDGGAYMSYISPTTWASEVAEVDLSTGVLTNEVATTLNGNAARVAALAHLDDTVYAFVTGSTDTLYSLDPSTGVLTQVRAASGVVTSGEIVAADSTSDGRLYLIAYTAGVSSTLYSLNPAVGGVTTLIGPITGLANGEEAVNLAIATLLDSERPADPPPAPTSASDSDRDREEEVVEEVPPPPPPVYKPPTKTLPIQPEAEEEVSVGAEPEPEPEIVEEPQGEPEPQVSVDEAEPETVGIDGMALAIAASVALALILALALLIALRTRARR